MSANKTAPVKATQNTPKRDGTGGGNRANQGRGGCSTPKQTGNENKK